MQTMEMGPAEAAMTQMTAIPSASSSYFLQLDPSGQVDILDSSLMHNKPDMVDETVYEIQLDSFMMDERNVEIINLQNFQNAVTFPQEFLGDQQFAAAFDSQVQYQVDELNLNELLMNAAAAAAISAPAPTEPITETFDETVPDFTVETEVECETEPCATTNSMNLMSMPGIAEQTFQDPQTLLYSPMVTDSGNGTEQRTSTEALLSLNFKTEENLSLEAASFTETFTPAVESEQSENYSGKENNIKDDLPEESLYSKDSENTVKTNRKAIKRTRKLELPDNIMEFTEEAVIPPRLEISPTSTTQDDPIPPIVVTLEEDDVEEDGEMEGPSPLVSTYLHEGIDPDDELYISYLSRPDSSKTAMCVLCYNWFESNAELEEHLKSVHENNMKLYGCKRCGKQFWSRFLRQRHEKQHRFDIKGPIKRYFPKNRPFDHYESRHFFKRFRPAPFTEKYLDHLREIHTQIKSAEHDCIACNKIFQTEEDLREHYDEEHAIQTCVHCDKHVENAKELRKHEQEVHGIYSIQKNYPGGAWKLWDSWECDEMREKDERLVNLFLFHNYNKRVKTEQNTGEETSSSICDKFVEFGCEEVTVSELEVAKVVEKKEKVEEKPKKSGGKQTSKSSTVTSANDTSTKPRKTDPKPSVIKSEPEEFDQIEFFEETKCESHIKREDLPFKCDCCKMSFDNDPDLQRHLKSHSIRTMAYMCQYCGRGFATHSNRKEHERIHTGDKPYVCPICNRAFVQISNLKKHIQTHKDKNNLQCSTCNKQFVKESSLILHQRAHSQDRKFRCHICDRAYNYASLLKRHMRIHTGENPYSCEDCGMQFHELVSLHYHRKKVHTGERPHRCEECGRAFILSSDLKKHLKIHLRDNKNGNSIKSSSGSSNVTLDSPSVSSSSDLNDATPASTNGASDESLTPPMESDDTTSMDIDFNNSSLVERQTENETAMLPPNHETNRILVITENDLLNATRTETNVVGALQQEFTTNYTNQVTDLAQENTPNAVP